MKSSRLINQLLTLGLTTILLNGAVAQTKQFEYFKEFGNVEEFVSGDFRVVDINGRKGVNTRSIHSRIRLNEHTLGQKKGSVTMWVASLEDLSTVPKFGDVGLNNPDHRGVPLLSSNQNPQKLDDTAFKWIWKPYWHASFRVMWVKGHYYWGIFEPHPIGASVIGNDFHWDKHQWYQLTLTWDHDIGQYRLYANGVLIGTEPNYMGNEFRYELLSKNSSLYTGSPQLCYSSISFYDKVLDQSAIQKLYLENTTDFNDEVQHWLYKRHNGTGKKDFDFNLNQQWEEKLSLSLQEDAHLKEFYVQGYTEAPSVTSDGLRIQTPPNIMDRTQTVNQVYLWSWETFEGDLYIEYEFKINKRGGLSLLMFNASGMNREDFMRDYKLRTTGTMRMVAWEDVRNYHWEYYRDQIDARNDVSSSAMLKNPFQKPMDYNVLDKELEGDVWHKLQLVQRGNHIVGAVDGIVMIDAIDDAFGNNGPVFNYGHIAIRCMLNSDVTFRNLKVYNRNLDFKVIEEFQSKSNPKG